MEIVQLIEVLRRCTSRVWKRSKSRLWKLSINIWGERDWCVDSFKPPKPPTKDSYICDLVCDSIKLAEIVMMVSNCSMRGLSIERQVLGRRSSMTWSMVISNLKLNCHKRDQKYTEYCMLRRTLLPVFFLCGGEILLLGGQWGWHHGSWHLCTC